MGLRTETVSDLELSLGTEDTVDAVEQPVMAVMRRVLEDGPVAITEFRERIRDDVRANATSYQDFPSRDPGTSHRAQAAHQVSPGCAGDDRHRGRRRRRGIRSGWLPGQRPGSHRSSSQLAIAVLAINAVLFFFIWAFRRTWVKRTPDGMLETERWEAFRRYLRDFSRLEEAPSISLALWERYLVYAIAFGIADEILASARLHAPEELHQSERHLLVRTSGDERRAQREHLQRVEQRPVRCLHPAGVERLGWGIHRWRRRWRRRRRRRRRSLVSSGPYARYPNRPGVVDGVAGHRQIGGSAPRSAAAGSPRPAGSRYGAGVLVVPHSGPRPAQRTSEAGGDLALVESARDYLALRLSGHLEVGDGIGQLHELAGVESEEDDVGLIGTGKRSVDDGARFGSSPAVPRRTPPS